MKKNRKRILLIPLIALFLCNVYFVIIAFRTMDEDFWQWGEQPFQNGRSSFQNNRPFETGFKVEHFPNKYRKTYPTLEAWWFIWYELPKNLEDPLFRNARLEEEWPQIDLLLQERHPIVTQPIPEDTLIELSELEEMRTLREALDYSILVDDVVYGELALWQDQEWVEAKQAWETIRIQAMILGTYFYFLEEQSDLDVKIYDEIDDLISTVGTPYWFQHFSEHLNTWWPEG